MTKPCPMCSEQILATAKKCKHCGSMLEGGSAPQAVTVTGQDPFAEYHTPIQGKKEGRLSVIGGLGICVGILFVLFSFHLFSESGGDEIAQQNALYTLLLGVAFILGNYFWARKK